MNFVLRSQKCNIYISEIETEGSAQLLPKPATCKVLPVLN